MMRKPVGGRLGLVSLKGHLQPTSSSLFHFHAEEDFCLCIYITPSVWDQAGDVLMRTVCFLKWWIKSNEDDTDIFGRFRLFFFQLWGISLKCTIIDLFLKYFPNLLIFISFQHIQGVLDCHFCQRHCCKPFNASQLGFCCTFKKQNNPYRGLQVELGLRSTCFAWRGKEGAAAHCT